tara:strand:+ start:1521 stop:2009 length:489 start_codon:yes stop_codon:yes gene_type:complete
MSGNENSTIDCSDCSQLTYDDLLEIDYCKCHQDIVNYQWEKHSNSDKLIYYMYKTLAGLIPFVFCYIIILVAFFIKNYKNINKLKYFLLISSLILYIVLTKYFTNNYLINGDLHKKKPQVGPILIALSYIVFLLIFTIRTALLVINKKDPFIQKLLIKNVKK